MIKAIWATFKARYPSRLKSFVVLGCLAFGVFIVSGLLITAGALGLAWTETEQFCIGCHEMRDNVYAEYKGTIHDTNRTGVRAICSDCHVPRPPIDLIKRKMAASMEVWGHLTGVIDTKEKFEAHRSELAQKVWRRMKATDSLECRNCHHADKMNSELQSEKARARHSTAKANGKTCIDCHIGIAHKEPAGPGPAEMKVD
ncbi:MAG: NapC/NirT family cytochrome c [Burkholderiales bacterium]|nr:NapC/NirT family cytochrome c [Burkholderiales bacterium]